jgi:gamma-glutamyl-gamma-aminobutyrate hydrolase PuuD
MQVKGLCLAGGGDLYSPLYGQAMHPTTEEPEPWRDLWERYLMLIGWILRWPVFGICRGMQQANVVRGGGLYQDIRTQWPWDEDVPSPQQHRAGGAVAADNWATHVISLHPQSRFLQWASGKGPARYQLEVLTMHHQMVGVISRTGKVVGFPAPGLVPTATSFDGVIEALEDPDPERVVVLVQFHPEWAVNPDGSMQDWARNLFDGFVRACEGYTPLGADLLEAFRPGIRTLVRAIDQQWLGWSAVQNDALASLPPVRSKRTLKLRL